MSNRQDHDLTVLDQVKDSVPEHRDVRYANTSPGECARLRVVRKPQYGPVQFIGKPDAKTHLDGVVPVRCLFGIR